MKNSDDTISFDVTTAEIAEAMCPESSPPGIAFWNLGVYEGTKTPYRKMTGREVVTVTGRSGGASIDDHDGGWMADRFGRLGATQFRRLIANVKASR